MPVTLEKHKLLQKHCFAEYEEEADEMAWTLGAELILRLTQCTSGH